MSKVITLEERAAAKKKFYNSILQFVNNSNGQFALLKLDYLRDKKHLGDNTDRRVWGVIKDNFSGGVFNLGMYGNRQTLDYYVTIRERQNKTIIDTLRSITSWTKLNITNKDTYYRVGESNKAYDLKTFDNATSRLKEMSIAILTSK